MSNRRGKVSGKHYGSTIDYYLRDSGYKRKHVPKDGCCLFRAVAEQVYLTQTAHWELRRLCAGYIKRNPSKFKSFLTVPIKDYCWKLANCNLWGGEMELVALSELLEQNILVYQEQRGEIITTEYKSQRKSDEFHILLAFTGNNHYDTVWSNEEENSTSLCQSIVYELLVDKVLNGLISQQDKAKALKLRSVDFYSPNQPVIFSQHPQDLLRGLGTLSYFNVPFIVSRREREAHEKADRHLAVSLQFTIGDKCQISYEGTKFTGDIVSGLNNGSLEVFVKDLSKRVKVPVGDVMLQRQQQQHSARNGLNKSSAPKGRHHQKTGSKADVGRDVPPRKSYSKSSKNQPKVDQQPPQHPFPDPKDSSSLPGKRDDHVSNPKGVPADDTSLEKAPPNSSSNAVGFSDTTVRMSSLMGRGNPLDFFNQASLASINEAPESEWPILHAGGGVSRGNLADIGSGMNAHRFHLDGPPPANPSMGMNQVDQHPPQLPFAMFPSDPMRLLIQEMNPPIHLLKSGTKEDRQQFMYEFAQNALRFYSKYVSDPEIEDSLHDLFCMEFDEFVSSPATYAQGDFSVVTSLTSREGSQCDVREQAMSDNSEDVTPRGSEEERTTSDTHTESPVEPKGIDNKPVIPSHEATPMSPTDQTFEKEEETPNEVQVPPPVPNGAGPVEEGTQPDGTVSVGPIHPMMIHPGAHPPYGFPGYPHPMWFPGPMFPWPYYHPMSTPFVLPPQMMSPPFRPPLMTSPTNEEMDKAEEDGETIRPLTDESQGSEQDQGDNKLSAGKEEDKQRAATDPSHKKPYTSGTSGEEEPHPSAKTSKTNEPTKLKEGGNGGEDAGSVTGSGPLTGERNSGNNRTKTYHRKWTQNRRHDHNRSQQPAKRFFRRPGGKDSGTEQQQTQH